ncbi:PAAR domain-containing protein [Duganella sp. FT27W]|uniref:PAAR domain-containing protein n=1 Tax=Duganella sp. FT27W TaxID=2654636 RepID=UPI00128CE3A8|nr:PAAR domain-containing protein [Duganella sp. FT27W]MPQ57339.1 hypothetical protein [Duganella sp. FT27W]
MKRYHITLGASTSAGGKVISASSACLINGVRIALEGDQIFCPACKSPGKIALCGTRIPESWNGKQVALQDDLCLCRCPSPPRLIAIQSLKCQILDGDSATSPEAAASLARQQIQSDALQDPKDQIVLRLLDDYSQQPLAARRYRLEFSDKVVEGQTDSDGYTAPFDAADRKQLVAWQVIE